MVGVDDGACERSGCFLRQVVVDVVESAVLVGAGELLAVRGTVVGWGEGVLIAVDRDGRHLDRRAGGQALLDRVETGVALGEPESPAVVVDDDVDVVGIVERGGGPAEGGVVVAPARRVERPDQACQLGTVGRIREPGPTRIRREGVLVPPGPLCLRRQWGLAGVPFGDQVAGDGYQRFNPFWPQGGDDVGGPGAPVEPGEDGPWQVQGVQERDQVERDRGLLTVAERGGRSEGRGAVSAQVGDDDPVAVGGQERSDPLEAFPSLMIVLRGGYGGPVRAGPPSPIPVSVSRCSGSWRRRRGRLSRCSGSTAGSGTRCGS
jgi:hypothetical protein